VSKLLLGDCFEQLKTLPENSVGSVVTDPPYELGFMGKSWDASGIAYSKEMWEQVLRVIKPGGYLLSFGGTRTYHRMACAIEDAGFEIRDQLQWLYGSGFPKSYNISKGIDKRGGASIGWFGSWLKDWRIKNNINQKEISKLFPSKTGGLTGCVANWELGLNLPTAEQFSLIVKTFNLPFENIEEAEREVVGKSKAGFLEKNNVFELNNEGYGNYDLTKSKTNEGKIFEGWGSALKPANEPICLARKPLSEKSIVENCLRWGVGGLNIDESRIGNESISVHNAPKGTFAGGELDRGSDTNSYRNHIGRFPSNVLLDEESAKMLDEQSGISKSKRSLMKGGKENTVAYRDYGKIETEREHTDFGGASRFFYVAKASKRERNEGLEGFSKKVVTLMSKESRTGKDCVTPSQGMERFQTEPKANHHPTVKPVKLMEYLVRLITPVGGVVLDPFMGSGTTGVACRNLGFNFVGIEKEAEYFEIAKARIGNQQTLLKEEGGV